MSANTKPATKVSADITEKNQEVEIGDYDFWKQYSDHVPVIISFNFN